MKGMIRGDACTLGIGSISQAMQAEAILYRAGICVRVADAADMANQRGCAYGILYPCHREDEVIRILKEHGLRLRGGGKRG